MAKVLIVYWSGTGNTEKMAELIAEGARSEGAEVVRKPVSVASPNDIHDFDVVALGSPSMGNEVVEETEMEPFVNDIAPIIKDRRLGLFGSYDWGDGEWMRTWTERMEGEGAKLVGEGLIVRLTPEDDEADKCRDFGKRLAKG